MADNDKNPEKASEKPVLKAENPASDTGPSPKPSDGRRLALVLGAGLLVVVIALVGFEYSRARDLGTADQNGVPDIGGPFELTSHSGETVTDKDFSGRFMLIFFGYTYCPDVCPTALYDMSVTLDLLDEDKAGKVIPLFISVDPVRDTPAHLEEYVGFFHPKTIGLTGTEQQIKDIARQYRVYYRSHQPSPDDPLDYLIDHTSIVYLMGPDGRFVTHFSYGTSPEKMAERLGQIL